MDARNQGPDGRACLFAAVGPVLTRYEVDTAGAALHARESVTLPGKVQYVWQHPGRHCLYVASSDGGPGSLGVAGRNHFLNAFAIDGASGALRPLGEAVRLAARPIHLSVDHAGRHLLACYNQPSGLSVHRLAGDGRIGDPVAQPDGLETGIYAHQILAAPGDRVVIMAARGHDAVAGRTEEPGALLVYDFADGRLSNRARVAPGDGYGFGPRHLAFHPARPWLCASIERQNQLQMFRLDRDGAPGPAPCFTAGSLRDPAGSVHRQHAGAVHVHPGGHAVYQSERSDITTTHAGRAVFAGGENSILVWRIDPESGAPRRIQNIDTRGFVARTFAIMAGGTLLIAANQQAMAVRRGDGGGIETVPASLVLFRIGDDGRLRFARRYPIETGDQLLFWAGAVWLP